MWLGLKAESGLWEEQVIGGSLVFEYDRNRDFRPPPECGIAYSHGAFYCHKVSVHLDNFSFCRQFVFGDGQLGVWAANEEYLFSPSVAEKIGGLERFHRRFAFA